MSTTFPSLETLIRLAGLAQLALVAVTPIIPHVLHWRSELALVSVLTRRLFLVYASYILCTNVAFGLMSTFVPRWLLETSSLSTAVCAYIFLYWGARLVIQLTCFRGIEKPAGRVFVAAEAVLIVLFVSLTSIYGLATFAGLGALE